MRACSPRCATSWPCHAAAPCLDLQDACAKRLRERGAQHLGPLTTSKATPCCCMKRPCAALGSQAARRPHPCPQVKQDCTRAWAWALSLKDQRRRRQQAARPFLSAVSLSETFTHHSGSAALRWRPPGPPSKLPAAVGGPGPVLFSATTAPCSMCYQRSQTQLRKAARPAVAHTAVRSRNVRRGATQADSRRRSSLQPINAAMPLT